MTDRHTHTHIILYLCIAVHCDECKHPLSTTVCILCDRTTILCEVCDSVHAQSGLTECEILSTVGDWLHLHTT